MTDTLAPKLADPKRILVGAARTDHSEGMSYLQTLPRRLVTVYLPLSIGAVVRYVGIRCGAISSDMRLSSEAARSIG